MFTAAMAIPLLKSAERYFSDNGHMLSILKSAWFGIVR